MRDGLGALAADERAEWIWGRRMGRLELATLEAPPARVALVCTIETTWYHAAKGKRAPEELYYHHHDPPFQLLVRAAKRLELVDGLGRSTRSARGVTLPVGPALAVLGRLVQIDGTDARGRRVEVGFPMVHGGALLLGVPENHRMLILGVPLWVTLAGSPCRVTPDGLVK